ncbi:response regulator [Corallococcus praedator]|uniref:Response regulator n=3 Tax=Corallococcus TaxID=83461 RepID=A0A3A8JK34_9BACT|nr:MULTISPECIES: response regulator [Corallococcus]MBE4747034.1 response regulator [Corallococcus soli]MCY1046438.1 response regulator [Corallococcus sp. bb12-1]RKG90841.1 response regulator [Corallococcus terminator]RKH19055.1 response regulator [Corallococcus sp. CA047B]RKH33213.1 response regulator [Corallococcus sp. CA031C]
MAEPKPRVLVVDDDPDLLDLVQRSLSAYGFEVQTHTSALGVSNIVRASEPDFVLIDVNFPALKGDKVVGLARQYAPPGTRFILYSASDEAKLRSLAIASGADGYISKSVQGADLAQKLNAMRLKPRPATPGRNPSPVEG